MWFRKCRCLLVLIGCVKVAIHCRTIIHIPATKLAVSLDLDWVVVETEHNHLDWKEVNEHVRAGLNSDTAVFLRRAEQSTAQTKRSLDVGENRGGTQEG